MSADRARPAVNTAHYIAMYKQAAICDNCAKTIIQNWPGDTWVHENGKAYCDDEA